MPHKAPLLAAAPIALAALLGLSCAPDMPAGRLNAPCTRSRDCESDLACLQGVCVSPDSSEMPPADSGADGTNGDP